jgi:hypothetical protein
VVGAKSIHDDHDKMGLGWRGFGLAGTSQQQ